MCAKYPVKECLRLGDGCQGRASSKATINVRTVASGRCTFVAWEARSRNTSLTRLHLTDQQLENNNFRFAATSRRLASAMDVSMDSRRHASENEPELSPLEQEVLDEYAKLVGNLDNVSDPPVRD